MKKKIYKTILSLIFITVLSKIIGFVRDIFMAKYLGATYLTDVYIISTTIPLILFESFAISVGVVYVRNSIILKDKHGKDKLNEYTSSMMGLMVTLGIVLSFLGIIFSEQLISIFAYGFDTNSSQIANTFLIILLPCMIIIGMNKVLYGYLKSYDNFSLGTLMAIPNNFFIIIGIILAVKFNSYLLAVLTVAGYIAMFLIMLIVSMKKYNLRLDYKLMIRFTSILSDLKIAAPVFLSTVVYKINTMVDRSLASTLSEGSISALNYSHKIDLLVYGIISVPIIQVMYVQLVKQINNKENEKETISNSFNLLVSILTPIIVVMFVLAKPIVEILYQRGVFNIDATTMTSGALRMYSLGIVGIAMREFISKIFYANGNTKTPMKIGVMVMGTNIILNFIIIRFMGHIGLAMTTSLSATIGAITLLIVSKKQFNYFDLKKVSIYVSKVVASSLVMALFVNLIYFKLNSTTPNLFYNILTVSVSSLVGLIAYISIMLLLLPNEYLIIRNYIKSNFNIKNISILKSIRITKLYTKEG